MKNYLNDKKLLISGCGRCGSTAIHACPGEILVAWSKEKIAEFEAVLTKYENDIKE